MSSPLYHKLINYSSSKTSFHMPGHKFGEAASINKLDLSLLDHTEATGMDNLYEATGVIKEAMELMAEFYGASDTLFLTNGSTAGILAAILSLCKDNDRIIVARNCHHSVWSALVLSGAVPIYVSPEYLEEDHMIGVVKPEDIERAIQAYPDAKGVIVVSPTYEGIVSPIKEIADIVHKYGKVLMVDEAHGSHFVLGECFPLSSIHQGADIVINSMHKTLPALTQSALLHRCSDRISYSTILSALRMIQTSSPSYMMMGLMDYIRCYILKNKESIKSHYINSLVQIRGCLKELKHLRLLEIPSESYDISKIVLSTVSSNIDGYGLSEILYEKYNISVEAALDTHIILITTFADNEMTFSNLGRALKEIDETLNPSERTFNVPWLKTRQITEGTSLRSVYYANKYWEDSNKCLGKLIAQAVMLYPPGIPLICMGEVLTKEHIKLLLQFKERLQGIKVIEGKILVQVTY